MQFLENTSICTVARQLDMLISFFFVVVHEALRLGLQAATPAAPAELAPSTAVSKSCTNWSS